MWVHILFIQLSLVLVLSRCTNSEKHFCVKSSNLVGSDSCWSIGSFLKGFDWLLNLVVFTLPMVVMN